MLGQGGFGITYLARDVNLDQAVAVKEYLPEGLAQRGGDASVRPTSDTEGGKDFQWGLERFIQEARTLSSLEHPNIVRVRTVFEANGTAYMVMDYERGESFKARLERTAPWTRRP